MGTLSSQYPNSNAVEAALDRANSAAHDVLVLRTETTDALNDKANKSEIEAARTMSLNGETYSTLGERLDAINSYITPQMFGAKGDNENDDTQSIIDAISYCSQTGNILFFPKGIYIVTSIINISNTIKCRIYGEDVGSTKILLRNGAYIKADNGGNELYEFSMSNITIDAANSSEYCFFANRITQCYFDNVYFYRATTAAVWLRGYMTWFRGCYFYYSNRALMIRGSQNNFKDCNFWDNGTCIYIFNPSTETNFENTWFEKYEKLMDCDTTADYLWTPNIFSFSMCHFIGSTGGRTYSVFCNIVSENTTYFSLNLSLTDCRYHDPDSTADYLMIFAPTSRSNISFINTIVTTGSNVHSLIDVSQNTDKKNIRLTCINNISTSGKAFCSDYDKVTVIGSIQDGNDANVFYDGFKLGSNMPRSTSSQPGFLNYDEEKRRIRMWVTAGANDYRYIPVAYYRDIKNLGSEATNTQTINKINEIISAMRETALIPSSGNS